MVTKHANVLGIARRLQNRRARRQDICPVRMFGTSLAMSEDTLTHEILGLLCDIYRARGTTCDITARVARRLAHRRFHTTHVPAGKQGRARARIVRHRAVSTNVRLSSRRDTGGGGSDNLVAAR